MSLPPLSRRYVGPVTVIGVFVECELRGLVKIVAVTTAPIPWPIGEKDGQQDLVVYKGLAKALRVEKPESVAAWWGVSCEAVERWRRPLMERSSRETAIGSRSGMLTAEQRRKLNAVLRRRCTPLPAAGQPWEPWQDHVISTQPAADAAKLIGRTLHAIHKRRHRLGMADSRTGDKRRKARRSK